MIDKEIEILWESNTTLPLTHPGTNKQQMKFIELKIIQSTLSVEEQLDYITEVERNQGMGIGKPELPDALKPVIGTRSFNTSQFTIMSWNSIWDKDFDCELIIADLLWSTGIEETVNLPYSKKDWKQILTTLGYE